MAIGVVVALLRHSLLSKSRAASYRWSAIPGAGHNHFGKQHRILSHRVKGEFENVGTSCTHSDFLALRYQPPQISVAVSAHSNEQI
jgi:hypothetical protein